MKYLRYFENNNIENEIKIHQEWIDKRDNTLNIIKNVKGDIITFFGFDKFIKTTDRTSFLSNFELVPTSTYKDTDLNFNKSIFIPEDKAIIGAYFITLEDSDHIEILNIKEYKKYTFFADGAIPYDISIKNIKLLKSQIEIIKEVPNRTGFYFIKIPYWLYKENKEDLEIKRIEVSKRIDISLKPSNPKAINDFKNPFIKDYFKSSDFDRRTQEIVKSNINRISSK
jgi:hypothetical protein